MLQEGWHAEDRSDLCSSGQIIDEKIPSVPELPGSANSFTTDDRFVDSRFYIDIPEPGDVLEWLHDTNSANDAATMQFPDSRIRYGAISPQAQFAVDGTTPMNGETVTHLSNDGFASWQLADHVDGCPRSFRGISNLG